MTRLIITRLLTIVPMMFVIASVVFFLVRFVPGDPARIMVGGQRTTPQTLEAIRAIQPRQTAPDAVQDVDAGSAQRRSRALVPAAARCPCPDRGPAADHAAAGDDELRDLVGAGNSARDSGGSEAQFVGGRRRERVLIDR